MTKQDILEEHLTGHYVFTHGIPQEEVDNFKKAMLEAMDKYARQQVNNFVLDPVMPSIILTQTWVEDEEDKNGWIGSGWGEPEGYEIDDIIEEDKYYNSTKAIFTYSA